jgi:peptidoglycan/xylan/chitin deacetylase (PgdA/CDA1 family)
MRLNHRSTARSCQLYSIVIWARYAVRQLLHWPSGLPAGREVRARQHPTRPVQELGESSLVRIVNTARRRERVPATRAIVGSSRARMTVGLLVLGMLALPSLAQARPTYVSLTFDDGSADQMPAVTSLAAHGMRGTFYINSGLVGSNPYYMNWAQVAVTAALGNEIGGHTAGHSDLTTLSAAEQTRAICDDRQALAARGYDPVSLAYPYAKWNATSRTVAQSCGYTSARGVGNVGCLPGCVPAETLPPPDPFVLRTPAGATTTTPVETLEGYVTNAVQNGGGWVILVLHNICDGCGSNSTTQEDFTALLDWLQDQASAGVSVKTVREVMSTPPPPPPPNLLQNAALENGLSSYGASCWLRTYYAGPSGGGNSATWQHSSDAHSAANAESVMISPFADGDQKLISVQDPVVPRPALTSAVGSTSGGALPEATYFYRLTATSASGETTPSGEVSVATWGSSGSVTLSWSTATGATGYRIYRSTAAGAERLLASVGNVTTYSDTGSATPGSMAPPTSNTASRSTDCSPVGIPGHVYQVGAWYKTSSGANVRMVTYYRDASGSWQFWREQALPHSTVWRQAVWQTSALPAGATAIGVGFSLRSVGTAFVDDLAVGDLSE